MIGHNRCTKQRKKQKRMLLNFCKNLEPLSRNKNREKRVTEQPRKITAVQKRTIVEPVPNPGKGEMR